MILFSQHRGGGCSLVRIFLHLDLFLKRLISVDVLFVTQHTVEIILHARMWDY